MPQHQERTLRVAMWDGKAWQEPAAKLEPFYPYRLFPNFENPIVSFDGKGNLTMVFRTGRGATLSVSARRRGRRCP